MELAAVTEFLRGMVRFFKRASRLRSCGEQDARYGKGGEAFSKDDKCPISIPVQAGMHYETAKGHE